MPVTVEFELHLIFVASPRRCVSPVQIFQVGLNYLSSIYSNAYCYYFSLKAQTNFHATTLRRNENLETFIRCKQEYFIHCQACKLVLIHAAQFECI